MSRPTPRDTADLTARLRRVPIQGRSVDPAERSAFLNDERALLDRIATAEGGSAAGEDASQREAVDRLVALGYERARAEAMVAEFVDDQRDPIPPTQGCIRHDPDSTRREQLARWHADDQTAAGPTDAQEWTIDADGR